MKKILGVECPLSDEYLSRVYEIENELWPIFKLSSYWDEGSGYDSWIATSGRTCDLIIDSWDKLTAERQKEIFIQFKNELLSQIEGVDIQLEKMGE